jgi:polyribonucleotide nucleotidyltransferase
VRVVCSADIPLSKAVAGVRVGMVNGRFIVNPTVKEQEASRLDLVMAGTAEAILMIEGFCDFLTDEQMLEVGSRSLEITLRR